MPTTLVRRYSFSPRSLRQRRRLRLNFLIHPLQLVDAPDLLRVLLRDVTVDEIFSIGVGQHVFSGLVHELGGLVKAIIQRDRKIIPAAANLAVVLLGEQAAQGSGDHALLGYSCGEGCTYGNALEEVAGEMHTLASPSAPFGATQPCSCRRHYYRCCQTAVAAVKAEPGPQRLR